MTNLADDITVNHRNLVDYRIQYQHLVESMDKFHRALQTSTKNEDIKILAIEASKKVFEWSLYCKEIFGKLEKEKEKENG